MTFLIVAIFLQIQVSAAPKMEAPFQMKVGDILTIVSDKGIRNPSGDRFEAIGNVIIIHGNETIYGERATISQASGQVLVEGNVRFIGETLTMYGQELTYNMHSKFMSLKNGRILSSGYTVVGEYFARINNKEIIAKNAEYSTCLDCPESWTVFGKEIYLTLDEYIHIKHAIVKSKRATILYLPYAIFPVKRGRQSGLLFPEFYFSSRKGMIYRQPLFLTLGENKDLTLIPSSAGKRGFAHELEYRHVVGEKKWFEVNLFNNFDRIYRPNEEDRLREKEYSSSGHIYQRYMGNYEHHLQVGNALTHHFVYTRMRDTDMLSDFERYTHNFVRGGDLTQWGFVDIRNSLFNLSMEGSHNQNLLLQDPKEFDHEYVQTMPRFSLSMTPIPLLQTDYPFLHNISAGAENHFTYFKQNRIITLPSQITGTPAVIRNAERWEFYPYVDWNLGSIGPVSFKTHIKKEMQYYHFPHLPNDPMQSQHRSFHKTGNLLVTEAFFELDRIWGPAYAESIPVEKIEFLGPADTDKEGHDNKKRSAELIGNSGPLADLMGEDSEPIGCEYKCLGKLPPISTNEAIAVSKDSHRHSLFFNIRHYLTTNQNYGGNEQFAKQITYKEGVFDDIDVPRDLRSEIGSLETRRGISQRNTLEFRILNSLFRKRAKSYDYNTDGRYLKDNFIYSKVAYFNISQGVEFDTGPNKKEWVDRLTRLYVSTGFPLGQWSFSLDEYYFHKNKKQDLAANVSYLFPLAKITTSWKINTLADPTYREIGFTGSISPFSTINLSGQYNYNLTAKKFLSSLFAAEYAPLNRCWRAAVTYAEKKRETIMNDREFAFNIWLNFGEGRFTSLLRPGGEEGVAP